jgi:hypothetical protein
MHICELPVLDEHAIRVAANVNAVWPVVLRTVERGFSRPGTATYARVVGSVHCTSAGPRPLAEGSTLPGFRVSSVVPESLLVLEGSHRFSSYALIFHLDESGPGRSLLRAESRAEFPGLAGGVYRQLVVGTGAHVFLVRRLLGVVKRRSELHS